MTITTENINQVNTKKNNTEIFCKNNQSSQNQDNQEDPGIKNKKNSVVALKYENGFKAPKVIAKGEGYVAEKILEVAKENDVFIHTDKNLAENLGRLELGSDVPPELFEIVAQIYIFADKIDTILGEEKYKYTENTKNVQKY